MKTHSFFSLLTTLFAILFFSLLGCSRSTQEPEARSVAADDQTPKVSVETIKSPVEPELAPLVVNAEATDLDQKAADISRSLPTLSFSSKTTELLKNEIVANYQLADEKTTELENTMESAPAEQNQLLEAVKLALMNSEYVKGLESAYALQDYKMSDQQTELFHELTAAVEILALGQGFSESSTQVQGDIGKIISGIKSKDTLSVVDGLQGVYSKAELTDSQKKLVGTMVNKYAPQLKDATDLLKGKFGL